MTIDLLVQKSVVPLFFADCGKYVSISTVHSSIKSINQKLYLSTVKSTVI